MHHMKYSDSSFESAGFYAAAAPPLMSLQRVAEPQHQLVITKPSSPFLSTAQLSLTKFELLIPAIGVPPLREYLQSSNCISSPVRSVFDQASNNHVANERQVKLLFDKAAVLDWPLFKFCAVLCCVQ